MKIGIVSDIHEDIMMLKNAMQVFNRKNCDILACLGDITGFSDHYYEHGETHDAHQCIEIIKNHFDIVVKGNHDLNVLKELPHFHAGIEYPDDWFELPANKKKSLTNDRVWLYEEEHHHNLMKEDLDFLKEVPEVAFFDAGNYKLMFSHYIFPDLSGSLKKFHHDVYDFLEHFRFMNENNIKFSFCGHFHVNGAHVVHQKGIKRKGFRKTRIKNRPHCIVGPVIASGGGSKGIMIFDTVKLELNILKLKNE